jgi:small-conductance mechanosensitive channel
MKLFVTTVLLALLTITPAVVAEGVIGSTERLQELQQRRSVTVPEDQKSTIIAQCGQGKANVIVIQAATESSVKKRLAIYETIQKEIKAIELRMSKQGADASEIDLLIGKLQQNLDAFTEKARYSQQLAEDISTIDCNASPEIYKAAADEYIETRNNLYTTAAELKKIIITAPNDTFTPLADRLKI